MKKAEALKHWRELEEGQDPLEHMSVIPYKTTGSRFGACGIRIDGNPEFVDAVLSNLKTLLDGESDTTRLELVYNDVKPTEIDGKVKSYDNASENAQVCYIRLHERGGQAKQVNTMFGIHGRRKK